MSTKKVVVIGAGFAGLSAATTLADMGYSVPCSKTSDSLGRANFGSRRFPFRHGTVVVLDADVFERYFGRFGKKMSDYYELVRLDPGYTIVFERTKNYHTRRICRTARAFRIV